jgi:Tol biopolymer transport system component
MKKRVTLIFIFFIWAIILNAQDMFDARPLTTDPAQQGFATWSPDGKYIVYQYTDKWDTIGNNGLWKISEDGTGAEQIYRGIAEHPKWSPDGHYIVFDADTGNSIKMIPSEGGMPITFLHDSIRINKGGLPRWSPDASRIAFLESTTSSLCVHDIKAGNTKRIFKKEGMLPMPGCWTNDGKSILIALMDRQTRKSTIWKISPDGMENSRIEGHHENLYRYLALSPCGSLLAYAAMEGRYLGLYVMPFDGGSSLPLAVTPTAHNEAPRWSPDGRKIAFNSTRSDAFNIWIMQLDIDQIKTELELSDKH